MSNSSSGGTSASPDEGRREGSLVKSAAALATSPPARRHKLQGVRLAGPQPLPPASQVIQRSVSSRGGIQIARQRVHVGLPHAGRIVRIELGDTTLRVTDSNGELLTTAPRTSTSEISRFKAYGSKHPRMTGR